MLVPSKRLWFLVALGIPLALVGSVIGGFERIVILYNLGLLVLFFVTGNIAKKLTPVEIKRRTDKALSSRVSNKVQLTIENVLNKPIRIRVKDDPPEGFGTTTHEWDMTLKNGQQVNAVYNVTPYERGQHEFGNAYVRFDAPLGLAEVQLQIPISEPIAVYPNILALADYDLLRQKGQLAQMGVRRSRVKGLGQEFESLRDYHDDDVRMVDWKATARRGKLVVKNFEEERNQAVFVCLDVGRGMLGDVGGTSKLDYALDAALMLMHAAVDKGDQVGLLVFNDVVHSFSLPRKGRQVVGQLLHQIHDAKAEPVQTDYVAALGYLRARFKRRSLIVVFTDAEDEQSAKDLVAALNPLRARHLVFVVRVDDPKIKELRSLPGDSRTEVAQRAAALWYSGIRDEASRIIETSGLQSIDAEPQDLSAALVTAYLVVKEKALL